MATIDVGSGATNRGVYRNYGHSALDNNNPADGSGSLDTFEVYAVSGYNLEGFKIGTFSGSGTSWTLRDYENIGNVTAGSKQTFTGKNCDVQTNDLLGEYHSNGRLEVDSSGFGGIYSKASTDVFALGGTQTYTLVNGYALSIYATGATAAGSLPLKNVFNRPFSGVFR
jgi:hypothetical protein